jgi:hypothetical protein
MKRRLIVTHHAPDLDAIGAVWMLKRFDTQHYGTAKVSFVDPGSTITAEDAEQLGFQLHEVTHVDTGFGEFDHHQPERGQEFVSATSLTYKHICNIHPDYVDNEALKAISEFVTEIDHFREIYWPESDHQRYSFMIHELVKGVEFYDPHNDDSQLQFGLQCLDSAYGVMTQRIKAEEIITQEGVPFECSAGKCLGIETSNDETIKLAQKQGYNIVIRKDPKLGNIRIKARPDANIDLKPVADAIEKVDSKASWYYHPSGKMLINGSRKHRNQKASQLPLKEVIGIITEVFSKNK